ncbi:MAG: DUF6036 family nucleotidyltransferase [Candidatus Hydrothermarchaeota archaeon]
MEPKMFTRSELINELERIGSKLGRKLKIFLIGGCSMVIRGYKVSTKDIDVIYANPNDLKDFVDVLKSLGFYDVKELPKEYQALGASTILRDPKGFQFDLFHRQVCRGLEITERMVERAEFFGSFGNLDVYLMSPEDIFLFKCITEREADLLDMRTLAERGLDWNIIKEECFTQEKRTIWEYFLVDRLEELKERTGIEAPIIKELWKLAGDELVKKVFVGIIKDGDDTFDKIFKRIRERYNYSESWTRKRLRELVDANVIRVEREGKRYRYFVD